jgi:hypothetical protein
MSRIWFTSVESVAQQSGVGHQNRICGYLEPARPQRSRDGASHHGRDAAMPGAVGGCRIESKKSALLFLILLRSFGLAVAVMSPPTQAVDATRFLSSEPCSFGSPQEFDMGRISGGFSESDEFSLGGSHALRLE